MANELIAVVDDNPEMLELLEVNLKEDNFSFRGFSNAEELFKFLKNRKPDLIILDLMLPGMDGFQVCKRLKKTERLASIPIIVLSGKGKEADKVLGLDLGSDDYLVKPCSFEELKARIRAVLRRRAAGGQEKKLKIADIVDIDLQKYEVAVNGEKVNLTATEFRILECLSLNKGHVFTRERLLDYLWGDDKIVVGRTIDVHITHLREKLGKAGELIKNLRGVGYKLDDTEEDV